MLSEQNGFVSGSTHSDRYLNVASHKDEKLDVGQQRQGRIDTPDDGSSVVSAEACCAAALPSLTNSGTKHDDRDRCWCAQVRWHGFACA